MIYSNINRSNRVSHWSFPSRTDYENHLANHNVTSNLDEIWNNKHFVQAIQRDWHSRGQNGCIFAQILAKEDAPDWTYKTVLGNIDAVLLKDNLMDVSDYINYCINDPGNNAVSILYPQITKVKDYVMLIRSLLTTKWFEIESQSIYQDVVMLSLRTPLGNTNIKSWVVGFAPFEFLPITRRAPIVEFVIRTKEKLDPQFYLLCKDENIAHLAQIPMQMENRQMEKAWLASQTKTRTLYGGASQRDANKFARAKVTTCIPSKYWVSK